MVGYFKITYQNLDIRKNLHTEPIPPLTTEAVSLVPSHIAICLIYCESIWFKSHKEKSHMKSYDFMTFSIFGQNTFLEDFIISNKNKKGLD